MAVMRARVGSVVLNSRCTERLFLDSPPAVHPNCRDIFPAPGVPNRDGNLMICCIWVPGLDVNLNVERPQFLDVLCRLRNHLDSSLDLVCTFLFSTRDRTLVPAECFVSDEKKLSEFCLSCHSHSSASSLLALRNQIMWPFGPSTQKASPSFQHVPTADIQSAQEKQHCSMSTWNAQSSISQQKDRATATAPVATSSPVLPVGSNFMTANSTNFWHVVAPRVPQRCLLHRAISAKTGDLELIPSPGPISTRMSPRLIMFVLFHCLHDLPPTAVMLSDASTLFLFFWVSPPRIAHSRRFS